MKCIQHQGNGFVRRESNELAKRLVDNPAWRYCPKSTWKAQRRAEAEAA